MPSDEKSRCPFDYLESILIPVVFTNKDTCWIGTWKGTTLGSSSCVVYFMNFVFSLEGTCSESKPVGASHLLHGKDEHAMVHLYSLTCIASHLQSLFHETTCKSLQAGRVDNDKQSPCREALIHHPTKVLSFLWSQSRDRLKIDCNNNFPSPAPI